MSHGHAQDWLQHAEADLRYAKLGRNEAGILPNLVAFHAQQAIEKALKGILVADDVDFPKTHDLEDLLELIRRAGRNCPTDMDKVGELTPMAVQTRYPGFDDPVTEAELEEAIGLAEKVIAWVKGELGLK